MQHRPVVLVNSNEMRPPVAPLALDYIGDRLQAAGYPVRLIDLSFAEQSSLAVLTDGLADIEPVAVGVSFRNTDDCFLPSGAWFVPRLAGIVQTIRSATSAPIVLGGCGFSVFPIEVFDCCKADLAIVGDGEDSFLKLVQSLEGGDVSADIPGLVIRGRDGGIRISPPAYPTILDVPPTRSTIDNAEYLAKGGMGNVETKRGCPHRCIYCADPVAKGRRIRCRPAGQVVDEVEQLLRQGVDVLHLCDGEFNIPDKHAQAVCEEMIRRKLGERVRWNCYATVYPFPADLADTMRRAGCVGINFGVDSGCERMLKGLRRSYGPEDIRQAVYSCKQAGIAVMLDLLIGGPNEDEASVRESVAFLKGLDPYCVGAATGIRIYPGTELADVVRRQGAMMINPNLHGQVDDNESFLRPVFYLDRQLGESPIDLVIEIIGGDERFFPPPRIQDASNYNYNDNRVLEDAIAAGHRGAFWDILRQLRSR